MASTPRWELLGINVVNGTLLVQDLLFNKPRSFHVPMLTNAKVMDGFAYVATRQGRVMQIDLQTAKRKFVEHDASGAAIQFPEDTPQLELQI
jgi:hypothetical protein